ncbi:MAG: universal stress protein [Alphaproteobacteria bacterium]|nr:universal stress protein [Alphaproteobacteria bacterium]
MQYRTLLCHLRHGPENMPRLEMAIALAQRWDAHLIALYVAHPAHIPTAIEGRGASAIYLAEAIEAARLHAEEFHPVAEQRLHESGVDWEWRYEESMDEEALTRHGYLADLVIVSQSRRDHFEDRFFLHLPDDVAVASGLPVLVVPRGLEHNPPAHFHRVLLAGWARANAARAMRNSMQILREADEVIVYYRQRAAEEVDVNTVLPYLKRHGVHARTITDKAGGGEIGKRLLDLQDEEDCQLLVMGASTRSALTTLLFGNTTAYVLNHMRRTVMLSR